MLPKNIRQIGTFGDTYKIYVEDFVYTYVHQFIHRQKKEDSVLAAVLLGRTVTKDNTEYVFISGAQKVEFQDENEEPDRGGEDADGTREEQTSPVTDAITGRQQEFWNRVYQRIKEYFDEQEILGWYFNLDGGGLNVRTELQQFFESTYKKGSRFLYYEDALEKEDAFFVQEQHKLQRISGYAVYYEKNPAMQEFMIAEKEKNVPKPLREKYAAESSSGDAVQNYRAIMAKLNEKPPKKKTRPIVYAAGAAVLAVAAATAVSQIGSYQDLKLLQQTMQTLSGAVSREQKETAAETSPDASAVSPEEKTRQASAGEAGGEAQQAAKDSAAGSTQQTAEDSTAGSTQQTAEDSTAGSAQQTAEDSAAGSAQQTAEDSTAAESADTVSEDPVQQTSAPLPDYYIVKKGDSLVSISKSLYNTTGMVKDICALNNIEDKDVIYEGQKLILPK